MANRTIRTPEREEAFLTALSETANVSRSCQIAGITRSVAYEWRDNDPDFKVIWDKALDLGTDALEDEAIRRAKEGTDRPVFYKGVQCGSVREYSDTMLIVMLKARRQEKFGDQSKVQHSGTMTVQTVNYAD